MRTASTLAAAALIASCSAPAQLPDLADAERHERAGRWSEAIAAYDGALISCRELRRQRQRSVCASAHLGRAEALDRMGRNDAAADAYEAIPDALAGDPVPSGRALYRAGELRLELGQERRAYELLWRALTDYPDPADAIP